MANVPEGFSAKSLLFCVSSRKKSPLHTASLPQWQDDTECTECEQCGFRFSVFIRKHHCRHCGRIFCGYCSSGRRRILKFGYITQVRVCVNCDAKIEKIEQLTEAVVLNFIPSVRNFVKEQKWNVNQYTGLFPPLSIACKNGYFEVAQILLKSGGADVNHTVPPCATLAIECSECGKTGAMEPDPSNCFKCPACDNVTKVADPVDHDITGITALHVACKRPNNIKIVELLLANGAEPNPMTFNGRTPLMIAAASGQLEYIAPLLKASADVNLASPRDGETALHKAARIGSSSIVEQLLAVGAKTCIRNKKGHTAYVVATSHGHAHLSVPLSHNAH